MEERLPRQPASAAVPPNFERAKLYEVAAHVAETSPGFRAPDVFVGRAPCGRGGRGA
jgi:hypothetical protein